MIATMLLLATQTAPSPVAEIRGEWINERKSAIIRVQECPTGLCGSIVWSTPAAQRDAKRGGTAALDGTSVMYGFVPASSHQWRGRLFLPDRNRTVRATIELQRRGVLKVKGCELGGLICRTQTWVRWSAE
jgi:uncharacterized protein (DUF2147 family)